MAVLKKAWECAESQDTSVVAHIMQIREQLQEMADLIYQNMVKAQAEQKRWYDRNARSRKFEPGDQVLVLLPTSTSKLLNINFLVDDTGQTSVESELLDEEILLGIVTTMATLKLGSNYQSCSKVTCGSY